MCNLKKVLTLVLTVAMLLSVMVVGTGAAFSDQSSIKNKEAVDVCSTLNIIAGMEDGSFRPANNVTRAQMCKMICVALNGGKEPTLGTNTTPTFSDVRTDPSSSWAESFIESCNSQGIVSGVGGGRFNPSGNVTGTQAARMLLVALGYRADIQGFTGDSWEINVNTIASAKGLYAGIEGIDANAALSRDNAAQMIWNALNAYEVEYVSQLSTVNGTLTSELVAQDKVVGTNRDKITLLEDKYEATTVTGIMASVKYDSADSNYNIEVKGTGRNSDGAATDSDFETVVDYSDLMGQEVKAMYTVDNRTNTTTLLGIYATEKNRMVTALADDIDGTIATELVAGNTVTIDDVDYDLASGMAIIAPNGETVDVAAIAKYHNITLVDNDRDGEYERIIVNPFIVTEVTSVTSQKVYFADAVENTNKNFDISKCNLYDGIAKDDIVVITQKAYAVSNTNEVVKAETISGSVSATRGTGATSAFRVDGTWYEAATTTIATNNQPDAGAALNSAAVVNGFYFKVDASSKGTVSGTAIVLAVGNKDWNGNYYDASLLFADGTTETTKAVLDDGNGKATVGTAQNPDAGKPNMTTLYTYEKKDDGYILKAVTDGNDIDVGEDGNSAISGSYSSDTNVVTYDTTATKRLATDAVVFVRYDTNKGTVITGADADAWSKTYNNVPVTVAFADSRAVKVMYVTIAGDKVPGASSDTKYAVILSSVMTGADDTLIADLWTSSGMVEEAVINTASGTNAADLQKNMVYEYTMDGDEYELSKINSNVDSGYVIGAVTDIDGNYIEISYVNGASVVTKEYLLTDDTTRLYVDTKNGTGSDAGTLQEATEFLENQHYANVIIVVDDDDDTAAVELGAIVIDLDNNLRNASGSSIEIKATPVSE